MFRSSTPWTSRQIEIIAELARGLSNREIAAECGLQPSTVSSHLRQISRSIEVSTRAGIVGYACRQGLLPASTPGAELSKPLSEREKEILDGISRGLTNKEIGQEIYLAADTVKCHARSLYRTLHVATRTEAVAVGYRLNLLPRVAEQLLTGGSGQFFGDAAMVE
ncbi:response regulator transcription factor [Streptomyces netropsis]|uniref:response regulator transcription factor n=1 Tax=Streptomyces netropsis TaxID=55404 RepID=UPI0037A0252E